MPPSAEAPNTVSLIRALMRRTGAQDDRDDPAADALHEELGEAEHFVLVLVDALGEELLARAPADGFLRRHHALTLRAVFPSATAIALTSLATTQWPAEHGVTGWFIYLQDHDLSTISLPFVERFRGEPLGARGVDVETVFPVPSRWSHAASDTLQYVPPEFAETDYSAYFSGGGPIEAYANLDGAAARIIERVAAAERPTVSYLYLPHLDMLCHSQGPSSPQVDELIGMIDVVVGAIHAGVKGRARLVVTADHGHIDIPEALRFVLREGDPLLARLRCPPSCETRVPVFHVRPGNDATFVSEFAERFGAHFALLTPDEAARLGLFGPEPLSKTARDRLGSFIGIAGDAATISYRGADEHDPPKKGSHGGLLPAEMRVPLILAS
jgi:hypothetical protein